jgi:flavin-dependent dehydrogenase
LGNGDVRRVRRLIGADGAASVVRKAVAPALRIDLAPARVLFAHGPGGTSDAIVMRFFAGQRGYAWNFPRPDHRSIGIMLEPGNGSRSRIDRDLDTYWDLWGRCECVPTVRAGAVIGTAQHRMVRSYPSIGGDHYALLGDAAGFADPATGEGIENALRSAHMAARAYAEDGCFTAYPRLAYAELEPEFRIARRVRRHLLAWSLPIRLIESAHHHASVRALLSAMINGSNEHDPRLVRAWLREMRRSERPRGCLPRETRPSASSVCRKPSGRTAARAKEEPLGLVP